MIVDAHLHRVVVEDFIVMCVEQQVPHARTPVAPVCDTLERIVEGDGNVGVLEITPAIHVELFHGVHVERWSQWLVEQLDRGNGRMRRVVIADLVQNVERVFDRVALAPVGIAILSRVIEPILRFGGCIVSVSVSGKLEYPSLPTYHHVDQS